MSNLKIIKEKERFLSNVIGVDGERVISILNSLSDDTDLYTYFVTAGACKTGAVDESELYDFLHKLYADFYCINSGRDDKIVMPLFLDSRYSPAKISPKTLFKVIFDNVFRGIMPIGIQSINKLEDKYFVRVDVGKLYAMNMDNSMSLRLYINMPTTEIIDFVREYIDRSSRDEVPSVIKFLTSDDRCDTVVIYTDYLCVSKIVSIIEEIKSDYPRIFRKVGKVSDLLCSINDYIGFGEMVDGKKTYFMSRTEVLSKIKTSAKMQVLKNTLVSAEKKVIVKSDKLSFTPTEYLLYIITKVAGEMIEKKIVALENQLETIENASESNELNQSADDIKLELDKMYALLECVEKEIVSTKEVEKLKKVLTRSEEYSLKIGGIDDGKYVFIDKLFNLFAKNEEKYASYKSEDKKKLVIARAIFRPTVNVDGINTKEFLMDFFRVTLADAISAIIDDSEEELDRTKRSSILSSLKQKQIMRLKIILRLILNDSDDGKEYIERCVLDYIRILSMEESDNVEVFIDGNKVVLDYDIGEGIIKMLPELSQKYDELKCNNNFIDNILVENGINAENIGLKHNSKNVCKVKIIEQEKKEREFYYKGY